MNRFALVFLALLAAGIVAVPETAWGCGSVGPPNVKVDVVDESALIIWDEASKIQHFIRRATFQSTGYDFGFLVPTPSRPELAEASDEVFTRLEKLTAPRIEVRHKLSSDQFGCGGGAAATSFAAPAGLARVQILEQKRVGDFDAVVLAATDAGKLNDWLREHAYAASPALEKWLDAYVKNGWIITAFRIAATPPTGGGPAKGSSGSMGLKAKPVRLSFKTDRPFYPYREPEDQRGPGSPAKSRSLRVYFAGPKRFAGQLGDGSPWPGKAVWANSLPAHERADLLASLPMPAATKPDDWFLTEFEDRSSPRPGTDEVYFEPSADQSPLERPPYQHTVLVPSLQVAVLSCCGLPIALGAWIVWRLGWRLERRLERRLNEKTR